MGSAVLRELWRTTPASRVTAVCVASATELVAGHRDGSLALVDRGSGAVLRTFDAHPAPVSDARVLVRPDGTPIAVSLALEPTDLVSPVGAWSAFAAGDSGLVVLTALDGTVTVERLRSREIVFRGRIRDAAVVDLAAAEQADGRAVCVTAHADGWLHVWDARTGREVVDPLLLPGSGGPGAVCRVGGALPGVAADECEDVAVTTYSGADGFEGATFERTSLRGASLRYCDLSGVTMRSVDVDGLDIDSHDLAFGTLFVNGVDVVPLVEAELDRRFPGRGLRNAESPEGLSEAWAAVMAAWEETVSGTPAELRDAHVDDEWSLAQTLRHLVLATDAWLRGGILRIEQPFHEIGQIFTGADRMGFDMSVFRAEPPEFEEVLAVRAERQQQVTEFLAAVTPELLAEERADPWGSDGWRPTVGDCIRVILEEEWAHLRYVRRDLARLG